MLLYGNLANPSSLFAYVKAGATTASVSMYVFWTHACVLIPKTRFPSNHVSKTLYPKTERILQVRACRNFRGSFEHRNCAIVHVHLELRLQHWKIFGYVTTPYPTAYIYIYIHIYEYIFYNVDLENNMGKLSSSQNLKVPAPIYTCIC